MPRILCAVLMLCLLSGCSSKGLSEGTARKELQSLFDGQMRFDSVPIGRISSHCQRDNHGKIEPDDLTPQKDIRLTIAQMAGYVTVTADGPDYWRVGLTEKGKKAPDAERFKVREYKSDLNGCDFKIYALAVAHPELARVLDIQRMQDAWIVNFTWKWVPSELGGALRKDGEIYSKLTPGQLSELRFPGRGLELPVPVPTDESSMKAEFRLGTDGVWKINSSANE